MAPWNAHGLSRRALLQRACAAPVLALAGRQPSRAPAVMTARPNDIRILEVNHEFEDFQYRAPYQFGGRTVDRVTLLNVNCRVRAGGGREAWGFGSMTLGNAWAFPAASQDAGLGAMRALAGRTASARPPPATKRAIPSISSGRSSPHTCARQPTLSRAAGPAGPHSEALHARGRERLRRGHP